MAEAVVAPPPPEAVTEVRFVVNTEPNLPIVVVTRHIEAIGAYAALLTVVTDEPYFPHLAYEAEVEFPTIGPAITWGKEPRPEDRLMRQAMIHSRLEVRVSSLSYHNPLEAVVAAAEGATLLAKVASILQEVAKAKADKRAELLSKQLDAFVREATLEFEVDRVTAEALRAEIEYESAFTQARRDLVMMALEIMAAQKKAQDEGLPVPTWNFEQTVSFLSQDPQVVELVRSLQSAAPRAEAVGPS